MSVLLAYFTFIQVILLLYVLRLMLYLLTKVHAFNGLTSLHIRILVKVGEQRERSYTLSTLCTLTVALCGHVM